MIQNSYTYWIFESMFIQKIKDFWLQQIGTVRIWQGYAQQIRVKYNCCKTWVLVNSQNALQFLCQFAFCERLILTRIVQAGVNLDLFCDEPKGHGSMFMNSHGQRPPTLISTRVREEKCPKNSNAPLHRGPYRELPNLSANLSDPRTFDPDVCELNTRVVTEINGHTDTRSSAFFKS